MQKYIDHTLLKATATSKDIEKICLEAKENKFKAVCINPNYITLAKKILADSEVKVCTVIGFPLGANTIASKVFETKNALDMGADEIDMVANIGEIKSGNFEMVKNEIFEINQAVKEKNAVLKVIIETCYLTQEEKIKMCHIITEVGADFIKTSTGFGTDGATPEDISLFKKYVGPNVEIKAAGGVRSREDAEKMVSLGATRIGTSNGIAIIKNQEIPKGTY